ncbi:hypothetical protein Syn8016DRAFT_0771 [Synechococcus sp. WH 8016]|nr:hypothetical protein Syn8016DRAFT_0771 [Synechococcus sp. WH 8016]
MQEQIPQIGDVARVMVELQRMYAQARRRASSHIRFNHDHYKQAHQPQASPRPSLPKCKRDLQCRQISDGATNCLSSQTWLEDRSLVQTLLESFHDD